MPKSENTDRTVWTNAATTRSRDVYHTDRDCRHLGDKPRPRDREPLEDHGWTECKLCADAIPDRGGASSGDHMAIYRAALAEGQRQSDG